MTKTVAPLLVLLLVVVYAPMATAQTETDLAVLAQQNAPPPNVVLLFDTSGSMNHVTCVRRP